MYNCIFCIGSIFFHSFTSSSFHLVSVLFFFNYYSTQGHQFTYIKLNVRLSYKSVLLSFNVKTYNLRRYTLKLYFIYPENQPLISRRYQYCDTADLIISNSGLHLFPIMVNLNLFHFHVRQLSKILKWHSYT